MTRPPAAPHVIPGRRPVLEALRARRPLREVLITSGRPDALAEVVTAAEAAGVAVHERPVSDLEELSGGVRHQGVVALTDPYRYADLDAVTSGDLVVVLDGLTDPRNLGAIARTAEQVGAAGLVIRHRRSAGVTPAAEKAAAGALSWLPVVAVPNITRALVALADAGLWNVGLDAGAPVAVWDAPLLDERVALVVGAEGTGLSRLVGERVDATVRIPTTGRLGSLNAATALTVVAFEWCRRRHSRRDLS